MTDRLLELEQLANRHGATIYDICHRNAGWGICWHESTRPLNSLDDDAWRQQLVTYRYYETPTEMVEAEFERLSQLTNGKEGSDARQLFCLPRTTD